MDGDGDDTDGEHRSRLFVVLVLVFVLALFTTPAVFTSPDGTGDLAVEITDKQGSKVKDQSVTIKNKETETVVFEGTTGPNGKVTATLEEGDYVVATEDTTKTVEVDEEGSDVSLSVLVTPPKAGEVEVVAVLFSVRL